MSTISELERLAELHQRGALSDDEYARAKAHVLSQAQTGGATSSTAFAPDSGANAVAAINTLRRSRSDRWLGGVCAGIGRLTGMEPWLWRLGFVLMATFGGTGVLAYLLLWIFVPEE